MEFFADLTPGTAAVVPVLIGAALLGMVFVVGDRGVVERRNARRSYLARNSREDGLPEFDLAAPAAPKAAEPAKAKARSEVRNSAYREEFFHAARLADVKQRKAAKDETRSGNSGSVRAHLRKAEEAARPKARLTRGALAQANASRGPGDSRPGTSVH